MKKNGLIAFLVVITFMFMTQVNASSVSIVCNNGDSTVTQDQIIKCSINATASELAAGFKANISYLNGVKYLDYIGDSSFGTNYKNGVISGNATEGKTGKYLIGTLQLKIDENITTNPSFSIKGGFCENSENDCNNDVDKIISFNLKKVTTTTTTTKAKSSNNFLSAIYVDGQRMDGFDKNKSKYYLTVNNKTSSITVSAKAEDDLSTVEINGPKKLEVGDNEFTIGVTSEDKSTKFYKVIVTREEEGKSSDTKLENIKIKGYSLSFDKNSKTFYLTIDKDTTKLNIEVITNNDKAKYKITGNEALKNDSVIKIIVTAENGDEDTYRIIIQMKKNNVIPIIISVGLIGFIITGVIIVMVIKKKKRKNKEKKPVNIKQNNEEKEDEVLDQSTKKLPVISDAEEIPVVDNDEEEATRFLSYEEQEELEKTKIINLDKQDETNDSSDEDQ